MADRREFLKQGAAAAAVLAVQTGRGPLWESPVLGIAREHVADACRGRDRRPAGDQGVAGRRHQRRHMAGRAVRRRSDPAPAAELRLHARAADPQRGGPRHDRLRRPRDGRRHVGIRGHARADAGRAWRPPRARPWRRRAATRVARDAAVDPGAGAGVTPTSHGRATSRPTRGRSRSSRRPTSCSKPTPRH